LGCHFRGLEAQDSYFPFVTFRWKVSFELWALGFVSAFRGVTQGGMGCICMCINVVFAYGYVYIYIYICKCAYMYICRCVGMCVCVYTYACVCVCLYIYICVKYMCICMWIYICGCMRICLHVHVWVSMYVYVCEHVNVCAGPYHLLRFGRRGWCFYKSEKTESDWYTASPYGLVDLQLPHSSDRGYHSPLSVSVTVVYLYKCYSHAPQPCAPTLDHQPTTRARI